MGKTKVGIVGVGYWGRKHVEEYSMLDGVEIAGICDASPKNLKDVGSLYNVENLYADYGELFARDDITAISVCTDNSSHYGRASRSTMRWWRRPTCRPSRRWRP